MKGADWLEDQDAFTTWGRFDRACPGNPSTVCDAMKEDILVAHCEGQHLRSMYEKLAPIVDTTRFIWLLNFFQYMSPREKTTQSMYNLTAMG